MRFYLIQMCKTTIKEMQFFANFLYSITVLDEISLEDEEEDKEGKSTESILKLRHHPRLLIKYIFIVYNW